MGVLLVAKELLILIHCSREVGSIQLLVFALTLPLATIHSLQNENVPDMCGYGCRGYRGRNQSHPLMVSTDRSVETIFISASSY